MYKTSKNEEVELVLLGLVGYSNNIQQRTLQSNQQTPPSRWRSHGVHRARHRHHPRSNRSSHSRSNSGSSSYSRSSTTFSDRYSSKNRRKLNQPKVYQVDLQNKPPDTQTLEEQIKQIEQEKQRLEKERSEFLLKQQQQLTILQERDKKDQEAKEFERQMELEKQKAIEAVLSAAEEARKEVE
ncbi:MAG: hypothetical protein EZS28_005116 [Streblomastix strix]|uniref:Uncharacterized protein n=1 Tax=Streblomastix strix TaxID=222440 RepID=A0A5J4WYE5_9EUKA|nr:MAG: hypothetical protein EZS28_005116 [Streblomastix strix]